tara:strand:- start:234 stop:449 length:216 start_codon:yes stop_codon:yes gene_type:complete
MKVSKVISLTEDQWALVALCVKNALIVDPMMTASVDSGFAIMDELIYAKPVPKKGKICKECRKKLERDFEI